MSRLHLWALAWSAGLGAPFAAAHTDYPPPAGPYHIVGRPAAHAIRAQAPGRAGIAHLASQMLADRSTGTTTTAPVAHAWPAPRVGIYGPPPYGRPPGPIRALPGHGPYGAGYWPGPAYPWPPRYGYPAGLMPGAASAPPVPAAASTPASPDTAAGTKTLDLAAPSSAGAASAPEPEPRPSASPPETSAPPAPAVGGAPAVPDVPAAGEERTTEASPIAPPEPRFRPWTAGEPATTGSGAQSGAGDEPVYRPGVKAIEDVPRPSVKRTEEGFLINGEPPVFRPLPSQNTPKTEQQTIPKAPAPIPVGV